MKRKVIILSILILSIISGLYAENIFDLQKKNQDSMVDRQRKEDLARKEAILKKMRGFMSDINGRLSHGNRTKITDPLDLNDATDIKDTDHFHTKRAVPPREFAFVNTTRVRLRAQGTTRSAIVGHVLFKEKIEVLNMSYKNDTIMGLTSPWYLIRRENNEEGWMFGAFLQKKEPRKAINFNSLNKEKENKELGKTSRFMVPTAGRLSSKFGYRVHPVTKRRTSFHRGIDIRAPRGTPVKAASDGVIARSEYNRHGYGNLIVIKHEKNLSTYYGHLSRRATAPGRKVKKGQFIGRVGSTGMSTGPHLHFEVRRGRTALDPSAFLR